MADNGPPNPPPVPNEPWLEALTFEQVAQLVNEVSPEVFYRRASAFDQAGGGLQDVLDQIRHEMNLVRESWTGTASDDFASLVRDVTAKVGGVLQFLQNPGYGATLRNAGDRLADHQRRFRDLQGQKTAQETAPPVPGGPPPEEVAKTHGDSAKQILRDLRTVYWDIGNALPGFPYKQTTVGVNDPNTVHSGADQNGQGNGNGEHNGNGPDETVTNGENGPGNQAPPVTNTYAAGGPWGLSSNLNNNVFMASTRPGQHGGGGEFQFGGDGPGGHHEQMLGRVDPDGQNWTAPGGGPVGPGPGMPGWPGQTFFAGAGAAPSDQPVLGRGSGETRKHVLPAADGDGETFTGVVDAVLGRPGICQPGPDTPGTTAKKKDQKLVEQDGSEEPLEQDRSEEPLQRRELVENLPDTVSSEIRSASIDLVPPVEIRTATDAPAPLVSGEQEITPQVAAVATTAGISLTPQGTPDTPGQQADAKPVLPAMPELDPGKSFAVTASGGGGGVRHAVALDPEQHGLFAPGITTPDGLPGQVPDTTTGSAGAGQAAARTDPYGAGSGHMGGMPMSPMMMGAMGGGMQQQNGRMAAMPNEPRPEVWDPVTGAPVAVGRRAEQEPEPEERQPTLTKEQVQAALAEKFAELDRLSGRVRDGGK